VQRNIDTQRKCNDQDNCGEHPVYIYKQINHRMHKDIVFGRCISRKGRVPKKVSFSCHYTIAPSCSVMPPFDTLGTHDSRIMAPVAGCNPSIIHHHSCMCSPAAHLSLVPERFEGFHGFPMSFRALPIQVVVLSCQMPNRLVYSDVCNILSVSPVPPARRCQNWPPS
jgi:hypothetical protein